MKRPIDLLVFDPQSEATGTVNCSETMQSQRQSESVAPRLGGFACTAGSTFEYGKAMTGLADSLKARNKSARQSGGNKVQKAKTRSRKTLSNALSKIFDAQSNGQDDVVARRPLKKPEDV